jgi:heme-degrading monooxygenase HmoA
MFARVSTITSPPDRIDDAARSFREQAVPFARQLDGFKGAYWLADRRSGTVLGVTLWESEEAMRASEAVVEPRRAQSARDFGASVQSVEEYEVIAQA